MVIREDRDLNISINQYKIIKEISAGINSRVMDRESCKNRFIPAIARVKTSITRSSRSINI